MSYSVYIIDGLIINYSSKDTLSHL